MCENCIFTKFYNLYFVSFLLFFVLIRKKSGNIIFGMDSVKEKIRDGSICLVLLASDISKNSLKEILAFANEYNVKTIAINHTKEDLEVAIGKYAAIIGISNENFSKKIVSITNEESSQKTLKDNQEEFNL